MHIIGDKYSRHNSVMVVAHPLPLNLNLMRQILYIFSLSNDVTFYICINVFIYVYRLVREYSTRLVFWSVVRVYKKFNIFLKRLSFRSQSRILCQPNCPAHHNFSRLFSPPPPEGGFLPRQCPEGFTEPPETALTCARVTGLITGLILSSSLISEEDSATLRFRDLLPGKPVVEISRLFNLKSDNPHCPAELCGQQTLISFLFIN